MSRLREDIKTVLEESNINVTELIDEAITNLIEAIEEEEDREDAISEEMEGYDDD